MAQYYPSEPWSYEYETARGKQSVTSVLWNVQQRKEYENRRKKQKVPRVRESVTENLTSCSRFTSHHRPTKNKNVAGSINRPPPQYTRGGRLDRRLEEDRPRCHRTISGPHSSLGYGRGEYNNRCQRGGVSHGCEQPTVRKRAVTYERQEKANRTNEHIGVKGPTALSPIEPVKNDPRSSSAGAAKPRRDAKEQSRSPQTPLQIDQHKQQNPKHPPAQPSTNRKRAWMYATRTLTPDSNEDESDEGKPSTRLSEDSHSDESVGEESTPNTRCHASSNHHRNHEDADSVYSNPKTTQSCSSVSSNSSSGTDTGTSSSATESEDEIPKGPTPYRPQSAQCHQSPLSGSAVPRKVCRVEQSPPEPKRPRHHSGDFPTHSRSPEVGKGAKSSRAQGRASCTKTQARAAPVWKTQRARQSLLLLRTNQTP